MKIIAFDICGKMAHFRKYYANNTALSYTIPPRTTLMGIVAAILGRERDSYYNDLSSNHLRIGVRALNPMKKTFHRLNLLRIESIGDLSRDNLGDFRGTGKLGGRIQTPFEVVSGHDLTTDFVRYRLYLAANTEGVSLLNEIEKVLTNRQAVFNISLGVANFSASLGQLLIDEDVTVYEPNNDFQVLHSAVPTSAIQLDSKDNGIMSLEEELLPLDFTKNTYRELTGLSHFVFSTNGEPFKAKVNRPFFRFKSTNTEGVAIFENILFLEK